MGPVLERRNDEFQRAAPAVAQAQEEMRPVFEICRGLRQSMQPFADLQERIAGIQAEFWKVQEQNQAVMRAIREQARYASAVAKLHLGPLQAAAKQLSSQVRRAQAFDEAGWLPHHSTPLDRVKQCAGDSEAVHLFLSAYYEERWPNVRRDIEDRLTGYRLDAEAKAAFREALEAHGASLYRCVCRLLFPEIERVTRRELHGDSMERITSQKALRDLAARLPASVMEPGGFLGLNLFDRLSNHVYEAASDEEARQRLARDPIPNRHAAVHGLVVYSTMQNSLNAIFITDYIFQLIGVLKELQRSEQTGEKASGREASATVLPCETGKSAAAITMPESRASRSPEEALADRGRPPDGPGTRRRRQFGEETDEQGEYRRSGGRPDRIEPEGDR